MTMGTGRIALVGLLIAGIACSAVSLVMAGQLRQHQAHRQSATTIVVGTVVEDGIGDNEDVRVRWRDDTGTQRTTRFGIYDTDRYVKGASFPVRYDAAAPTRRPFPADREETVGEDDIWAGIVLPWALVLVVGSWWLVRLARGRLADGGVPESTRMKVLSGFNVNAGPVAGIVRTTWAELESEEPGSGGGSRFQRMQWHPALAATRSIEAVTVSRRRGRAAVIRLADGTRLTPIGRLRTAPPSRFQLQPLTAIRSSLVDAMIRPAAAPRDAWIRTLLMRGAYGAVLGSLPGVLFGGSNLIWIGAVVGAAGTVNVWALYGADR